MTVVTVVAIAAVAAFFYAFVWPGIKMNILNSTKCATAYDCKCTAKKCECSYIGEDGKPARDTVTCPNNNNTDQ